MRWVIALVAALVVLVTTPAYAQSIPSPPATKPSAADEASAKKNFESGLKLYGEGSYAEALIAFEQSYRLGGRPSALKNIAQCHRNLKHFVEAYEAYEQMLALHEAQLPAADKSAVKQALDELGVLTGTIEVTVNEPGADIEIDGKSVGRSPMAKPKRVKVDPHTVKVTKAGFDPVEQQVTVGSQEQKKVDVKLVPEKTAGHLTVREQSGREAHVFIDAQDRGPAPWEGDVEAGDHTIEVKGARFASEARKIHVAAKEHLDLAFDAAPLLGRLRVTTVPATATIAVDGKTVGTGAWEGELPEGAHRVEVSLGGEPPQVRDVTLARGQTVVQEIPVVGAIASGRTGEWAGMYARFSITAMIGSDNKAVNSGGPPTGNPLVGVDGTGGFVAGGGATLRVGRAWDWWGFEGVGMFMFEHRDQSYDVVVSNTTGPGTTTTYNFKDESNAVNAFLGVGPRATTKDDFVRFTFGLAPGLAIRTFNPRRSGDSSSSQPQNNPNPGGGSNRFVPSGTSGPNGCQGSCGHNDESFNGAGYTTFGLLADAGVLLGSTPGTKFYIGANMWLDFGSELTVGPDTKTPIPDAAFVQPGRGVRVNQSVQFYVGPTIGLQFGH